MAHDIGEGRVGDVGALTNGDFGDILFAYLHRDLHLGQVSDLHTLLAAARVAFAHDHAAGYRSANLGIELNDAARAGGRYRALGRLGVSLIECRLGRCEVALGARYGARIGRRARCGAGVVVHCRCDLCGSKGLLGIAQVFLGRGYCALRLGDITVELIVFNRHEHVALVDGLAGLYVD